jgi:hypothetical protein
MLPDTATPHLEHPDVQPDTEVAADKLRAAAVRASELQPLQQRIAGARDLLHELRGFIAGKGCELPIDVEQKLTTWWHEDVMARKEQKS